MIRINLLPKEIEQKAAARKKVMLIGVAVAACVLLVIGAYFMRIAKLNSLNSEIKKVENELKKLQPIVKKVKELESKTASLNNKLNVIKELIKTRLIYPVFMEEFAALLPNKVWITSLNTKTSGTTLELKIKVKADDNYAVADFLNVLESSEKFFDVKFTGIITEVSGEEEIRNFDINCVYSMTAERPAAKPAAQPRKRKRRR
jgi:Tfp pilus assembly protein PilN